MTGIVVALVVVALAVGGTIAFDAFRRPGDDPNPDGPHKGVRTRADFEAEVAAPVKDVDEEAAAPLLAYVEEIGTGDFPALAFDADPLAAPIPEGHSVADPALFNASAAAWLLPAWPTTPTVPLASVLVAEPEPFEPEGFTRGWTREQMAHILAKGEASR